MAESDSQGEDLPPFTPLAQEKPQDLEDLPEYTPFSAPHRDKASTLEISSETPQIPSQQEGKQEAVVEEVLQADYVQEMVVAAEGPGDSVQEPSAELQIAGEFEGRKPEHYDKTDIVEETAETESVLKPEEQKSEEKPAQKSKSRQKKGGKDPIAEANTQSVPSPKQGTAQAVSEPDTDTFPSIESKERAVDPPQKPSVPEEEVKDSPQEPTIPESSGKRPSMQAKKDRKKVRSGRPAPATEGKPPVQEEAKERPMDPVASEQPREEPKPAGGRPVPEATQESPKSTVSEERVEEKPQQPSVPGQSDSKDSKSPAHVAPVPEEKKEVSHAPEVSGELPVEEKQPPRQGKGKQKQRSGKPPTTVEEKPATEVVPDPPKPAVREEIVAEAPKPPPTQGKWKAKAAAKVPVPEENKEVVAVPVASKEPVVEEKQPMQAKGKQKLRSGKPPIPVEEKPLSVPETLQEPPNPPVQEEIVEEKPKQPPAQAKGQLKAKAATNVPVPEENKEVAAVPVASNPIVEEKPKQPTMQAKGKQKLRSGKPPIPVEEKPLSVPETLQEPPKPPVREEIVEEKPKQPPAPVKGQSKPKDNKANVSAANVPAPEETKASPALEEPRAEEKPKQPTMQAKGKQKLRSGKPAGPSEEAPQTVVKETQPIPPPADVKDAATQPKPTPAESVKPLIQALLPKPTAQSSGWKKRPKEGEVPQPPPVSTPAPQPAEESKQPVQSKGPQKPRSGNPPVAPQEEGKAEAPRQGGLSAQARQKIRDGRNGRGPKPTPARPEEVPKAAEVSRPTGPKPEKDPQVMELEKQIHLVRERQKNVKLLTAKLQKSIEDTQAKKERVLNQIEKAKQTLTQLNEELAKSAVPAADSKSESLLRQLKAKVRVLSEDLATKEKDFADARKLKESKAKQVKGLETQLEGLEDQKSKLIAQHSEALSESGSYQSEIKRLEALIRKANEEIEQMKGSFSSLDLESELKALEAERTAKARELGEQEGRLHASLSLLDTEHLAYYPEQPRVSVSSAKLLKEIGEVELELGSKTREVEQLRGELEEGREGCCPLIFLLIGILLGVLVQQLVRY